MHSSQLQGESAQLGNTKQRHTYMMNVSQLQQDSSGGDAGGREEAPTLTTADISNLLRKIASPTSEMRSISIVLTFVDGDMAVFGWPVPEGWLPVPRDTSAHLATFLEVFKVVHSYGTETSSEASRAIR